jgi:hypothetical protein
VTGGEKPGDAKADQWRERFEKGRKESDLALERLKIRAEMRSANWEEDSSVIHMQAAANMKAKESEAPSSKTNVFIIIGTAVKKLPPWGTVIVLLAAIAAYVFLRIQHAVP